MELTDAIWRKSTRSSTQGGNCVEVADNLPVAVALRDSKHPTGPVLTLPRPAWTTFLTSLKHGTFDH